MGLCSTQAFRRNGRVGLSNTQQTQNPKVTYTKKGGTCRKNIFERGMHNTNDRVRAGRACWAIWMRTRNKKVTLWRFTGTEACACSRLGFIYTLQEKLCHQEISQRSTSSMSQAHITWFSEFPCFIQRSGKKFAETHDASICCLSKMRLNFAAAFFGICIGNGKCGDSKDQRNTAIALSWGLGRTTWRSKI